MAIGRRQAPPWMQPRTPCACFPAPLRTHCAPHAAETAPGTFRGPSVYITGAEPRREHSSAMETPQSLDLAESFSSQKVKKRFLSVVIPLQKLLNTHGFSATFNDDGCDATKLFIVRGASGVLLGLMEGERRSHRTDLIFIIVDVSVSALNTRGCARTRTDSIVGIIRTMETWMILGVDEIPDAELKRSWERTLIRCCMCHVKEYPDSIKFKQCRLCHDSERTQRLPAWVGFYCSSACQSADWKEHKQTFH